MFFDVFHFDRAQQRLWRGSEEIPLRPKALALLHHLLQRPGQLVTKQELLDAVWPGTSVSEAVLKVCMSEIRRALGGGRGAKRLIETRHRRGYRFISAPVSRTSDRTPAASEAQVHVLTRDDPDTRPASATRLVGRDAELAALREHFAHAIRGERQTVFVTGELGMGKSSFVDACVEQVTDRHEFVVIRGQCVEHREPEEPFQPILEALSSLCRQPAQDRVLGLLAAHAPSWMARLPGPPASATQLKAGHADEPAAYARMIREMVDVLERIAMESPVALILEDLQWADTATLSLMASLARPRTPAALVVLGTSVPFATLDGSDLLRALKQSLQVHKRCVELPLPPLTTANVAALLEARFQGARGLGDLAAVIHAHTEGNPLFALGVIDTLIAAGTLARRDKWWELAVQPSAIKISVPDHIHQALDLQFERLTVDERQILEAASVVGVEFTAAAVAAALEVDALPIEEWCETLVRRRLYLQSAGIAHKADGRVTARFRFTHTFYQQVLYQRILPRMRIRWHLRIEAHQQTLAASAPAETANVTAKRPRAKR